MPDQYGYLAVTMRIDQIGARPKITRIHRMVINTFIGPKPAPRMEVAHGNGNQIDNRLENLRWATRQENADDRVKHGSHNGLRNAATKLRPDQVREIRATPIFRGYQSVLGRKYGIDRKVIAAIYANKLWKHIL